MFPYSSSPSIEASEMATHDLDTGKYSIGVTNSPRLEFFDTSAAGVGCYAFAVFKFFQLEMYCLY